MVFGDADRDAKLGGGAGGCCGENGDDDEDDLDGDGEREKALIFDLPLCLTSLYLNSVFAYVGTSCFEETTFLFAPRTPNIKDFNLDS